MTPPGRGSGLDLHVTTFWGHLFSVKVCLHFYLSKMRFYFTYILHPLSSLGSTEVQERQECQYGENCTFAYCQEEIDVWTQERKGALSRELLFDPLGSTERRALSVTRLLQLHMGMFMFLCEVMSTVSEALLLFSSTQRNKTLTSVHLFLFLQECFDSKPRIISKRSKENLAVCSNLTARHPFDDNK